MKKDLIISAVVGGVAAVVLGVILSVSGVTPKLAGDFAGGIQPSQLLTASVSTNSESPALSNFLVPGAISAGGVAAANQVPIVYTAVANYPGAAAITLLSGATPSSSATTTQVAFNAAGFSIGDPCEIQYSFSTSTLLTSGHVTAVSGNSVTTTVTILNTTGANITATVTSTVTGVSSTIKATCFATGV